MTTMFCYGCGREFDPDVTKSTYCSDICTTLTQRSLVLGIPGSIVYPATPSGMTRGVSEAWMELSASSDGDLRWEPPEDFDNEIIDDEGEQIGEGPSGVRLPFTEHPYTSDDDDDDNCNSAVVW
jgi:hypothetical protein